MYFKGRTNNYKEGWEWENPNKEYISIKVPELIFVKNISI